MHTAMISRVSIENYKSIEKASFDTRRVNVFIGEPNSGKSNLLEAVAFQSPAVLNRLREICRVNSAADLFFDREIERVLKIELAPSLTTTLAFKEGAFVGKCKLQDADGEFHLNAAGDVSHRQGPFDSTNVRHYRYRPLSRTEFTKEHFGHLIPPFGANLPTLLYTNKAVRDSISAFFKSKGFRLELRPQDNEILMSKEVDDILYSFPFESISETMKRIVFYKAALESNKVSSGVIVAKDRACRRRRGCESGN